MIAVLEKVKNDIEKQYPGDKKGNALITDCLHHFCWQLYEKEKENNQNEQI